MRSISAEEMVENSAAPPSTRQMVIFSGKTARSLPPSTGMSVERRKMKVLLTSLVAKYLYGQGGGTRRQSRPLLTPSSSSSTSGRRLRGLEYVGTPFPMRALLSVPHVDQRVKEFLCRARLGTVLRSDSQLVASQTLHYRTVERVLSVGYIFELNSRQRARFVVAARKSLRRMRRAMDKMVGARRRSILKAIWDAARIRVLPREFGPLECGGSPAVRRGTGGSSATTGPVAGMGGRPELFNGRFFSLLDKAAKRKNRLSEAASRCP